MDEIDGMLSASQEALRFIMEKYSQNCKFILTANKEEQIIEPILSRCKVIRMTETPKESIAGKLVDICLKENVHMEEGIEFKIVDMFFPDMRRMINYIQGLGANITSDIVKTKTQLEDEYYNLLIQKQPFEARKFAISKALDPFDTMKRVLELTLEKENDEVKKLIGYEAAHAAEWMAVGADAEIELFRFGLKFCDIRK
jgi:replication factor C small subunit